MDSELYGQPEFIVPQLSNVDIKKQDKIIKSRRRKQPTDNDLETNKQQIIKVKEQRNNYDPYVGFLYEKNLLNTNINKRYYTYTINVDSRDRIMKPSIEISTSIKLDANPLYLSKSSTEINIKCKNNFNVNDLITITGLKPKIITVSSYGIVKEDIEQLISNVPTFIVNEITDNIFEFINNTMYMKIKYTHYLPINNIYSTINHRFENDEFYNNYDLSNLYIEIKDFKGNRINVANVPYYDNIPISYINTRHKLILADPLTGRIKQNIFFIKLPRIYKPLYSDNFEPPSIKYNFTLIFYYIGGIPINRINAEYPIDFDYGNGYHIITHCTSEQITIDTFVKSTGTNEYSVGGNNITCSLISKLTKGYPNPNQYNIQLNQIYNNIVGAKLISSEFPNTEKVIKNYPETSRNNRIYWQNLDDGDYIYMAEIPAGNYKANELEAALEKAFYNTERVNYLIDNPINITSSFIRVSPPYTNKNYIRSTINEATDVVTFKAYIEYFFFRPIISVEPEIPTDPSADPITETIYTLIIKHENHNLNVGNNILLSGAIAHLGIPANIINNEHKIIEVVDNNTYKIKLQTFNLEITRTITGGGVSVGIYIPIQFRLRFDKTDTLGTILGFRNVGDSTSITYYNTIITNNEKYEFELDIDEFGQKKTFKQNAIMLSGENYVHMNIKQLQIASSLGNIKDYFSKILLPDTPGTILFNTFVPYNKIFTEPIKQLYELDIEFYSPNGIIYDFNGINHSFTIELNILNESLFLIPKN